VLLKPDQKVLEVVQAAASRVSVDGEELSASQLLERFLFPPAQQHQPVAKLSGGERRRLHLCRLLIEAPNVLLLDEPTNDLDVQTLSVLEDFLEDFRGCVVVVSHDRYFLDRTVDRLFCFENGELQRFEGNYSAYLETSAARQEAARLASATQPAQAANSFKESRELADLETQLPLWEEQRRQLELALGAGGSDYAALEELTQQLAQLSERIHGGEERWLALSELAG
jgi:ATP-binding cassette subfamily F protein uup